MLKSLFRRDLELTAPSIPPVTNALPRLTGKELLADHTSVLNKVEALAGLPLDFYRCYYEPALYHYADFVQQLPASESHHHAIMGGILRHGLEVAMIALKLRRAYLLPSGATPEVILKKQDLWTYAIFSAALCHDIAKPAVDQSVTLYDAQGNERQWLPWSGPMPESVKWYRTKFRRDRVHRLHEKSALLLVGQILPKEGLDWLSGDLSLFSKWVACIGGDVSESRPIGEIVSRADSESVARNLGAEPQALTPGLTNKPLHEKLLTGLRYLLTNGELPLNRNGSAGWLIGDDIWLVSKRVIDTLRGHLLAEGHSGIPNRNDRIFDELQQRGLLIPCDDRAIWHANVRGDNWDHELTLIRLPASNIWSDPETRPESFSGEIIPDEQNQSITESETDPPDTKKDQSVIENKSFDRADLNCDLQELLPQSLDEGVADPTITGGDTRQADPGKQFLRWVQKNIQNDKLPIDAPNSRIYTVPEGFFLVSPAIFKEFIENMGSQSSWEYAQKRFLKLKLHIKTPDGLNVHKRVVNGVALHGIVVPEFSIIDYQKSRCSSV